MGSKFQLSNSISKIPWIQRHFIDAGVHLLLVRRAKGCTNNQGPRYGFKAVGSILVYFEILWALNLCYQVVSPKFHEFNTALLMLVLNCYQYVELRVA